MPLFQLLLLLLEYKPLSRLFQLIYDTKEVPEQWKIAKVIPTHKKGTKDNVENYRPISNLCAMSKIYEKLILGHLWELADSENIDLTAKNQHGFKKERSTVLFFLPTYKLGKH